MSIYRTVYLDYPGGGKKKITIAEPDSRDPKGRAMRVLWLLDGQNQFRDEGRGCWHSDAAARAYEKETGRGFLLVAIDNSTNRESELTMHIGEPTPEALGEVHELSGEVFEQFVSETLVPFIRSEYNVCWSPADNAVIGSSCGGTAAFCLALRKANLFGKAGVLSPAFDFFDSYAWAAWLGKLRFTEDAPCPEIIICCGMDDPLEFSLSRGACEMPRIMHALGMTGRVRLYIDSRASHNERDWCALMPRLIRGLFPQ